VSDAASDAAVAFADVQRVLALLIEGLLGRPMKLTTVEAGANDARRRPIMTDGESLVLPDVIDWFATRADNQRAYRAVVLHQLGYLQSGTFTFDVDVARERVPLPPALRARLDARSLPARLDPAYRMAPLERLFSAAERPALLRRVFVTLEDWRVDAGLARRYPGAHRSLALLCGHALAVRRPIGALRAAGAMVEALVRASLGVPVADLRDVRRDLPLGELLDTVADVAAPGATVYDTARCALAAEAMIIAVLLRRATREHVSDADAFDEAWPPQADLPGVPTEAAGEAEADEAQAADEALEGASVAFRGELMPTLVHQASRGHLAGQLADDLAADLLPDEAPPTDDATVEVLPSRGRAQARNQAAGVRSHLHDEWDCHAGAYLSAWCRVNEQRLAGQDVRFLADVRRRHAALFDAVRRRFGEIRPHSWQRVHRMPDGPELEVDGVVEAVIDRKAGHATDERLYLRRERGRRDVAAAFLVDMSASTDFPIPVRGVTVAAAEPVNSEPGVYLWAGHDAAAAPPPPPGRRVIDVARDALALMGNALTALGDLHAIYGFSGGGRDNVEFFVAKDFADRTSARTWSAVSAMTPRGATRMGAAIRHALYKMRAVPAATRVLIIVSDGYPEDRDYGPDPRDDAYGIADTAQALKEAERAGVVAYCVTIDPAGHDYLRRMCAPGRYRVIGEVEALPEALADLYREITA
jgi:hypothetical protein